MRTQSHDCFYSTMSSPSSSSPSSPRSRDDFIITEDLLELEGESLLTSDDDLPRLAYSRSSSTASSSFADSETQPLTPPALPSPHLSFTQRLRQRVGSVLQSGGGRRRFSDDSPSSPTHAPSSFDASASSRLSFLMGGPHAFEQNIPLPPGPLPVRKGSDNIHDLVEYKSSKSKEISQDPSSTTTTGSDGHVFTLRSREQVVLHFLMELAMLRRDALLLVCGLLFQWVHSVATNIAYYLHAKLTAAQRVPLNDVFFDALPNLNGAWWVASEYLVYGMIVAVTLLIASILVVKWHAPHRRPLYCIPILRRMLITLCAAQSLRIISFLITTLPGASRQCVYHVPEDMTRDEMMTGPAHDRGNPDGWMPPTSSFDILWRVDATNGCGDLMFSSHTIFTVLFICVVFRYFNWRILKWSMVLCQAFAIPFILAARKHYSVDVFTALYVVPLLFQFLKAKLPDMDTESSRMACHYGIRFYRDAHGRFVVGLFGNEFYMSPSDLPMDLQKQLREEAHYEEYPMKVLTESNVLEMTEVDPMIV